MTHAIFDALGVLQGLQSLMSPVVRKVLDLTPREIRGLRGTVLLQRIIRIFRKRQLDFGVMEWGEEHASQHNPLQSTVMTWPTCDQHGKCFSELIGFTAEGLSVSWIRSHQKKGDEHAGPAPAALAVNRMADELADKAAKGQLIAPTVKQPGVREGHVKIPACTDSVRGLLLGNAIDGDAGIILREMHVQSLLTKLGSGKGPESTTGRVFGRQWDGLKSPHLLRNVRVGGRMHNLREKAYATWTGCYGKLQRAVGERHSPAPWEGKCPLCNAWYEHYSTSHALVWCSHPDVTGCRTRMLNEVDRLLGASGVRPPVQRAVPPPPGNATPAVVETDRAFLDLRRAGNFLLDGDVDAMRGVPLEEIAKWLGTARTTEAGEPVSVPRDAVVRLLTDVVARLIVDGRRLLDGYNERVERVPAVIGYRAAAAAKEAVEAVEADGLL